MSIEALGPKAPTAYQVIIVGAGPAGLTLANLLGKFGVRTLIVERNPTTVQEARAVSIDDEALRTMQECGLIETIMTAVVPGYGSRYLTPNGECFLTVKPSDTPYGYPRRNAFRQPMFESQLSAGLKRFESVETLFGWTMTSFTQDAENVWVDVVRESEVRKIRGQYLVGCDGASSPVRKELGFTLEGTTLPERWLIIDLEDSPAECDTVVSCDWNRPYIALPGPNRTRRFEFKLLDDEDEAAFVRLDNVQRLLDANGVAAGSRIARKTVYTFHARLASHWSEGRVFLAGDAAHLTPPFAGQGMNSGIRDVHNLAWKLAHVLSGDFKSALLDTYEAERRSHVGAMIELALRMGRIMAPAHWITGWMTQSTFKLLHRWPALRSYFGEMKYKPQPRFKKGFLLSSRHPLVGRLLPQPKVRAQQGPQLLLDSAMPAGFVLLGVDVPPAALEKTCRDIVATGLSIRPVLLGLSPKREPATGLSSFRCVSEPDSQLALSAGTLLVVRPDRYVMAGFKPQDAATAVKRLDALLSSQYLEPRTRTTVKEWRALQSDAPGVLAQGIYSSSPHCLANRNDRERPSTPRCDGLC